MVNSEELIGTAQICRYRRGVAQTGVVITGFYCTLVKAQNIKFHAKLLYTILELLCADRQTNIEWAKSRYTVINYTIHEEIKDRLNPGKWGLGWRSG